MSFPAPSKRQGVVIWFALTTLAVVLTLGLIGVLGWSAGQLVKLLSPVLWPLAIGVVLAYLLSPVVNWLDARGIPRLRSVLLVFCVAFTLVAAVLVSIVPRAVLEARELASQVPAYAARAQSRIESWISQPPAPLMRFLPAEWRDRFDQFRRERGATNGPAAPHTNAVTGGLELPAETNLVSTNLIMAEILAAVGPTNAPPWWNRALDPRALQSVGSWVAAVTPEVARWAAGQVGRLAGLFGVLAGLALVPVYAFFLLLEEKKIARSWTDYMPVADPELKAEAIFVVRSINDALIVFFRGQVLVALCDGVIYTIGFLIIGLPYALLLGLMASFVTIIPFIGAALTCGTALIVAIVQTGDFQLPLLVLVVFGVVQAIEGFVLQPKIIGDRVGLHPLMIIVALMLGTTLLGGILGGILAIPITAALKVLMGRYVWKVPADAPAVTAEGSEVPPA